MSSSTTTAHSRVIVGLSGGVDSSVAALLLQQQGCHVEGLFMKNWDEDDGSEYCTAAEDLEDAKRVAEKLDIPLHQANFAAEYWDNVFEHFLEEYRAGRTPNPDVLCNREIKFNVFADYARTLGADHIATGHYARVRHDGSNKALTNTSNNTSKNDNAASLMKGLDDNKDQSYFLQSVSADQLHNVLFPLGELHKPQVRQMALDHGLPTHAKKDSTGICFIGERRFKDFLGQYLPAQPGDIESDDGTVIGRHDGLMYHTLGQRQGLHIGGIQGRPEMPWYVLDKNLERNVLVVGQGNDHPRLFTSSLRCQEIHWIGAAPALPFTGHAKVRYRQPDQLCKISRDGDAYRIDFDLPQRAVTPGQWACVYDGEYCLGGGIIDDIHL
jgi:tRNA-uridine 2-sulfurtransferase